MYSPQPGFINFILDGCEWRTSTIARLHTAANLFILTKWPPKNPYFSSVINANIP